MRPLQGQQNKGRAKVAAQGAERFHTPSLAADGIHQKRTGAVRQGIGNGIRIGRINGKRQGQPPHKALHQFGQKLGFVHQGRAHVNIKHRGPGIYLSIGQLLANVQRLRP